MTTSFTIIRDMTDKLSDIAEQEVLLNVLTLDDWVHLYRLQTAAETVGAVGPEVLYTELNRNGMDQLCLSLADRMIQKIFSVDPGAQLHEANQYRFNLMGRLKQGIIFGLTPAIFEI